MVIGAGVVGLACAAALAAAGREVVLLDRHGQFGTETSSRNSEVIHAGIYYRKDSLKARFCVEGRRRLYAYCAERGVAYRRLGKLIVAANAAQAAALDGIRARAAANGVDDLQLLTKAEALSLEPALRCEAALLSPSTGIVDSHGLMQALDADLQVHGGQFVPNTEVTRVEALEAGAGFRLHLAEAGEAILAREVVIAAGLHSSTLAEGLATGDYRPPLTFFAKGSYFTLASRAPFSRLIYPVPEPGGLGVHLTLDLDGAARFGPDVEWVDDLDYRVDPGRAAKFYDAIRSYWPALPEGSLQAAYSGIRPKITPPGGPEADFALHGPAEHGRAGLAILYGIESPGLTSALALGEAMVRRLA